MIIGCDWQSQESLNMDRDKLMKMAGAVSVGCTGCRLVDLSACSPSATGGNINARWSSVCTCCPLPAWLQVRTGGKGTMRRCVLRLGERMHARLRRMGATLSVDMRALGARGGGCG